LISLAIAVWNAADAALVISLVDSVPKRLQEVVQKRSNRTDRSPCKSELNGQLFLVLQSIRTSPLV
jgi:hypothetical protein